MTRTQAEITTPALVEVLATCPNCSERAAMSLHVSASVEIEDEGSSLKLKAKSKKLSHVCGQIPLPLTAPGQTTIEEAAEEVPEVSGAELDQALEALDGTTIEAEDGTSATVTVLPRGARPRR